MDFKSLSFIYKAIEDDSHPDEQGVKINGNKHDGNIT